MRQEFLLITNFLAAAPTGGAEASRKRGRNACVRGGLNGYLWWKWSRRWGWGIL